MRPLRHFESGLKYPVFKWPRSAGILQGSFVSLGFGREALGAMIQANVKRVSKIWVFNTAWLKGGCCVNYVLLAIVSDRQDIQSQGMGTFNVFQTEENPHNAHKRMSKQTKC